MIKSTMFSRIDYIKMIKTASILTAFEYEFKSLQADSAPTLMEFTEFTFESVTAFSISIYSTLILFFGIPLVIYIGSQFMRPMMRNLYWELEHEKIYSKDIKQFIEK